MTIQAKFSSKCTNCNAAIKIGEDIIWVRGQRGVTHATPAQCQAAKAAWASSPPAPVIDLKPIMDFLNAARDRGLKSPKLRVLGLDGKTELRLSITRGGMAPGSIAVTLGGMFIGCIRPDGRTTGSVAKDDRLQAHLLKVAENPAAAAKEYAALMGLCSFCGKQLTDDGSVEVGYGPVCAKHWGLPHTAKGTPALHEVV